MRPAEVWGFSSRPMASRSAISLRMVAEDTSMPMEEAIALEPTGSADWI